jgi:hypothetical protein
MTLHVTVTQKQIDIGKRGDCWSCAAAMAVKKATKGSGWTFKSIGWSIANFSKHKKYIGITLPVIAIEFIDRFDNGLSVEPISFTLELP